MVRATVAFAVIALSAAVAVIAQAPEGSSQLEARDLNNDLELREYVTDDLEARGDFEEVVDMGAREPELFFEEVDAREGAPEFFDDIEAREYEAEELEARATAQNPLPADPSKTVTTTVTPTPTPCTQTELRSQKRQSRVDKARAVLRSAKGKKNLSSTDKQQVNKARKYLSRVKRRKVWAAKRIARMCLLARRKADKVIPSAKCEAASRFLQDAKSKKKNKTSRAARKSGGLLAASKTTVGADGVTTVTINAGPTCTPSSGSSSRLRKRLTPRDDSVFAREYEFDNLD